MGRTVIAMRIAKVQPLLTARAVRGPFDYRLPEEMADAGVGTLLEVPFAGRKLLGIIVALAYRTEVPAEKLAEPLAMLPGGPPPELVELGLWVAEQYCSPPARGVALALPPGFGTGKGRVRARTERHVEITEAGRKAIADGARLGPRQKIALEHLASAGPTATVAMRERAGIESGTLSALAKRGLVGISDVAVRRRPEIAAVGDRRGPVTLSSAQRSAAETVIAALDGSGPRERLLWGVTGSGKTEVYLAAIEAALARGRGAILLVPEIGLTPQTVGRVRARLGESSAVLHSGLSDGERYDEWQRLRTGEARVCVGPRSAVFAPVEDLGLLIVDEEHDSSYKQEGDPRYDARSVGRHRAAMSRSGLPRRQRHAAARELGRAGAAGVARAGRRAGAAARRDPRHAWRARDGWTVPPGDP